MKRTFKRFSIVLIVVLTMASTVFSQITVQVYIENAQVNSGTYSWEIHFKPLSGWIEDGGGESYLAEASYYFNYNNAALSRSGNHL
ncbi:MAG: hypothetical protein U5R06_03005 [candidate division KSB1 bacterium]|nr:hypothetical protein [candidate division KSB1 bacterium]